MHPALWKETQDAVKTKVEKKASTSISANLGNQSQSQTLEECVARRTISWPVDSAEHKQRLSSLLSMVVATGMSSSKTVLFIHFKECLHT